MAANFTSGTADRLKFSGFTQPDASTGTIAFWWKPAFSPGDSSAYRLVGFSGVGQEASVQRFSDNNWYFGFSGIDGDDRATFSDTGTFSSGTWVHVIWTYDTGASPHTNVYFDNSSQGSKTGTLDTGTFTLLAFASWSSGNNPNNTGDICEYGCWNAVLSAQERQALVDGFSPDLVRGDALISYKPLIRDFTQDRRDGTTSVSENTPGIAAHYSGIIYPALPAIGLGTVGGGGGGNAVPLVNAAILS